PGGGRTRRRALPRCTRRPPESAPHRQGDGGGPSRARPARLGHAARDAPQLRHASPVGRRRPPRDPGTARPCLALDDAGLHGGRYRPADGGLRPRPSPRPLRGAGMTVGGDTPLGIAMRTGDRAALDRIARDRPGIAREADIFLDAVAACPAATVRWCLDNSADPNLPADDGFPSLHLAIDRPGPDRIEVVA